MILSVQNSGFLRKEYTMIYSIYRRICAKILRLYYLSEIKNAEKYANCKIRFVPQGEGGVFIAHPENFKIAPTSHLKSNTYIECSGGVSIGEYFHTGRGLTIFQVIMFITTTTAYLMIRSLKINLYKLRTLYGLELT